MNKDLIALLDPQEREFLAQQTTAENPTTPADVQDPTDPTDQPDPTDLQEPTPEAEPEQKAQPEEEDDIAENDPRAIAKMLKRINKLTARAKTAEETSAKAVSDAVAEREARIAELEAKLTQTTPASPAEAPVPTSAETPLAHVENAAQLQEEIARAKRIRAWAITHWDGVDPETGDPVEVPDGNGGTRVATAAEIRSHFSRCDEVLSEHAPARAEFLRQRTEQIELARTEYPSLFDTKSDEHRLFQQVLQALPEIRRFADPEVFVGEWLEGHRARMQRGETPKPTPIKQPERAPAAPVTKTPVPKVSTDKLVRTKALEEVFQSGGSSDAIERFFMATASRA
jgi:hypothetical protein